MGPCLFRLWLLRLRGFGSRVVGEIRFVRLTG